MNRFAIVKPSNVVMKHIFNNIQNDEYQKWKHKHMNRAGLEIFFENQFKHVGDVCAILYIIVKIN